MKKADLAGRDPDFPRGVLQDARPSAEDRSPTVAWTCVWAVNLIAPAVLASWMTEGWAGLGTVAGVSVVHLLGLRACSAYAGVVRRIVLGGWFVAASQLFPMLQVVAGSVGVGTAGLLGLAKIRGLPVVDSIAGAFVATLITAAGLIAASAAVGFVLGALHHSWSKPSSTTLP